VRIITYNVHKGVGPGKRSILAEAVRAAAEREPDILLCQEVYHGVEDDVHQCHFITEVTGFPHVFGPNAFYQRGCHGNATFADLPIAEHRNIDVTESLFEKRGILHTLLESEAGPVDVLNVHFSLTGRQRRRQWSRLLDELPDDPGLPVLACGDFNDWSGALDRRAAATGVLTNALWHLPRHRRSTFPARRPLFAMDRIYFRGFRLLSVRVLEGTPWNLLSDHLPVEAELELLRG
jgi:endonuclease/exonuclease/phosphatase family metal-dependent hydrolase